MPNSNTANTFDFVPAVTVKGEVIASNVADIKSMAAQWLGTINTSLQTDEDFAVATSDIKLCKEAETRLEQAKSDIVGQMAQVNELLSTIDDIKGDLAKTRLMLTKLVKDRESEIKNEAQRAISAKWALRLEEINTDLGFIKVTNIAPDFAGAVKNTKTLKSYQDRLEAEFVRCAGIAEEQARSYRLKRNWVNANQGEFGFLFADMSNLVKMDQESLESAVTGRIEAYQASERAKAAKLAEQDLAAVSAVSHVSTETPISVLDPDQEVKEAQPTAAPTLPPTVTPTSAPVQVSKPTNNAFGVVVIPKELLSTLKYVIKVVEPMMKGSAEYNKLKDLVNGG